MMANEGQKEKPQHKTNRNCRNEQDEAEETTVQREKRQGLKVIAGGRRIKACIG